MPSPTPVDDLVGGAPDTAGLLARLHDAHVERLAAVDPLVRPAVPSAEEADRLLVSGDVGGLATVRDSDLLWVARRAHVLTVRAAAPDAPAWAAVLDRWLARVGDDPAATDAETSATVAVASRDVDLVAPLVARHFGPASVLALRALDRPDPDVWRRPPPGVRIRPAGRADLPWLLDRSVDLHAWESRFGYVPPRPDARASLEAELGEALERDEGWTWLAELDGEAVAFCQVNPPESAAWVNGATWLAPAGYLVQAYVEPVLRSGGLGRVLAAAAHARAAEEGWAAMLLHHSGVSGWSTPFWASMGYRPLVTSWMRRPAFRSAVG
ncbi:GNAT family N-acetyltransferase [Nocardioides zeae]|uniref:GNAT superfamily N-acetyltransferase n=1 Tax=Nocardioides zeae TaxID=1457234 RepID=A0AAJ1X0C6_9ACTN|nr:GNAT family N-acetyltransferase [Nocardioides zeae]MDQ1104438.1 GNAT superfamily N-acetyltransferase [Nocardioides zeae]